MAPVSGTSLEELKRLFQKSPDELSEEEQRRLVYLAMLHEYDWKPAKAVLRFPSQRPPSATARAVTHDGRRGGA